MPAPHALPDSLCGSHGFIRGYWTLCASEATLRFHTSLRLGLSAGAHACAAGCPEASQLPLAAVLPSELRVMACVLRGLRPIALGGLLVAVYSSAHGRQVFPAAVGASFACLAASQALERFVRLFDNVRGHVLDQHRATSTATIAAVRDGTCREVPCSTLVQGDIVFLGGKHGSHVPADCRVLESRGLHIDDSFLHHRSAWPGLSVWPGARQAPGRAVTSLGDAEGSDLLDSACVVLSMSSVTDGTATALVTRTGSSTVACGLLSHLASFSLLDVLFSPWRI